MGCRHISPGEPAIVDFALLGETERALLLRQPLRLVARTGVRGWCEPN